MADRKDVKYLCVTWRDLLSNEGTGVSKKKKKLLSREVGKRRFKSLTDTLSDYLRCLFKYVPCNLNIKLFHFPGFAGISSFNMSLFSSESISSFCGPSSTLYYNATRDFSKAVYIFACGINMIISISSTLGNILVLCAIRNCESLHPPSKALLFSLAMTDLFVGIAALPLFIAHHLTIILEMLNYYTV